MGIQERIWIFWSRGKTSILESSILVSQYQQGQCLFMVERVGNWYIITENWVLSSPTAIKDKTWLGLCHVVWQLWLCSLTFLTKILVALTIGSLFFYILKGIVQPGQVYMWLSSDCKRNKVRESGKKILKYYLNFCCWILWVLDASFPG